MVIEQNWRAIDSGKSSHKNWLNTIHLLKWFIKMGNNFLLKRDETCTCKTLPALVAKATTYNQWNPTEVPSTQACFGDS